MSSNFTPSYLFKNYLGNYYFRCRIPSSIRKKYNLKKAEIRKSLKTGNRSEALRLSRKLWVEMEKTDYKMNDIEADIDQHHFKEVEGKRLLKEFYIAALKSKETGILEDEDIDTYFVDDYWTESETSIFFKKLNSFQVELLKKQLDLFSELTLEKKKKILLNLETEIERNASSIVKETSVNGIIKEDFADLVVKKIQNAHKKELIVIGLEEAFDKYIAYADKLYDWKDKDKHIVDISIFIDVIDIDKCCNISIEDIIKYRDIIVNLPFRYDIDKDCKKCKTYAEMAKLPDKKHASPNTIVNKVGVVKTFLRWCENSNYIDVNFEKIFKTIKKSKKAKKDRISYTPDELNRLFNSRQYIQGSHKTHARHWTLLIALFTGARLNEICQLKKHNIIKDSLSNIWYFDFNDYDKEKSKKTDAAIRFVPVHPQLSRLGFFKYLNSVDDNGRLFPMLKKKDRSYGTAITKFFKTYKNEKNCNIIIPQGVMKDFHSFRNTIINAMKQAGFPESSAREIVGHENPGLAYGGYADPLDLPNRKKIIDKIYYPSIDWRLIKAREW